MKHSSILLAFLLYGGGMGAFAQSGLTKDYQVNSIHYWFDTDTEVFVESFASGKVTLDLSTLEPGFHMLHYQAVTERGELSPARSMAFYRVSPEDFNMKEYDVKKVNYWFDDNTKHTLQTDYKAGTLTLDLSTLEPGFHMLHYQAVTERGELSPARSMAFYRVSPEDFNMKEYDVKKVNYWFDDNTKHTLQTDYKAGTLTLDLSTLEPGFHMLHYQAVTERGELSPARSMAFYRVSPEDFNMKEYDVKKVNYWFDDNMKHTLQTDYKAGTLTLDLSTLEPGFHMLHYQAVTERGELSPARSMAFYRLSPEDFNMKEYDVKRVKYWLDYDLSTLCETDYKGGIIQLDLSKAKEGEHTMCYQVVTERGELSPVVTTSIFRSLYDIYVSEDTLYTQSLIASTPLLQQRPDLKLHYSAANAATRGHLTLDNESLLSLGKYVQTAHWGSIYDANKYTHTGTAYFHPTTLINHGQMRADSVIVKQMLAADRWHFISLPFNTKVADIEVPSDVLWALRSYNGEERAMGNMDDTWDDLKPTDLMNAHQGYIIQLTNESSAQQAEMTFKALNDVNKNLIFSKGDATIALEEHLSEFAHNRSWNLIGNPYPSFYDTRYMDAQGTITVWNGNGYTAYSLADDKYVLMPFEAFFMQKPVDADGITFSAEGRLHRAEDAPEHLSSNRMNKRSLGADRQLFDILLSTDDTVTDRTRIVLNEHAQMTYETSRDAAKFMESYPRTAQLYSLQGGVKYAINERPTDNGLATLSVFIPEDGEYTLRLKDSDTRELVLFDTEKNENHILNHEGYTFFAQRGTHEARFLVSFTGELTDVSQVTATADGEIKVADGALSFDFIQPKQVRIYSADGRLFYRQTTASGRLSLTSGVYIVEIDGKATKIVVK